MNVLYKGEKLKYIHNFHGESVLWITESPQRNMELMKFVGGHPDEYCIFIKDILDITEIPPLCKKIKELEMFVISMNVDKFRKFACLESVEQYFNHYGLCGVVYEGDKYIWIHQDFPDEKDRPNIYYTIKSFDTIDELIFFVKRYIKWDLFLTYATETLYVEDICNHPEYGYCIICSELIDGTWKNGYYTVNDNSLQRLCDVI